MTNVPIMESGRFGQRPPSSQREKKEEMEGTRTPDRPRGLLATGVGRFIAVLFGIGVVSRLAPLLDDGGRLLEQFPTEDGYLMLTIARNLGLGNGMSTAAGTIPSNGTQPLVTLLWALGFSAVDGDKVAGVAVALAIQFLVASLCAWGIVRLGRVVFSSRADAREISLLAAATWYASPVALPHTMNCLETGLYGLVVVAVAYCFAQNEDAWGRPWPWSRTIAMGVLLGIAFWSRNDATFLILAACLTYLLGLGTAKRIAFPRRLARSMAMGSVSIAVASPWLLFNYLEFGHIVPISGQAERMFVEFAHNLPHLPIVLVEYFAMVLPIPYELESNPVLIAFCTLGVLAGGVFVVAIARRAEPLERRLIVFTSLYLAGLCIFYGLYFGASYFLTRYLFPVSALIVLLWSHLAWTIWRHGVQEHGGLARAAPLVLLALVAGLNLRLYQRGAEHPHFQVVEWVRENVASDVWVGAIQTGTLGYFHDRTINLDGKVNPEALAARLEGEIPAYVVRKNLQYLADWAGPDSLVRWIERYPAIAAHFEVVVEDQPGNLVVLGRKPIPDEQPLVTSCIR